MPETAIPIGFSGSNILGRLLNATPLIVMFFFFFSFDLLCLEPISSPIFDRQEIRKDLVTEAHIIVVSSFSSCCTNSFLDAHSTSSFFCHCYLFFLWQQLTGCSPGPSIQPQKVYQSSNKASSQISQRLYQGSQWPCELQLFQQRAHRNSTSDQKKTAVPESSRSPNHR